LNGDGLDLTLLEEASINKVDAFLAVTDDDKTNLLSCTRAKAAGCPLTISLVNDPSLNSLLKPTGVDAFINPRATTVSSILRHIRHGRVRSVYSIGEAEAELIEAQVLSTSSLSGKMIKEIDWPDGAIVGAIMQGDKIVIPGKETIFTDGDIITVFYLAKDFHQIERLLEVGMDYF
jgi:trk system potassium uptake protein TrkA